jgi:magnesium-transporting ATPase (P-type)
VLIGRDLDKLSDEELGAAVSSTIVFARTSPEHKLRLVKSPQSQGHIVAMTGEGVNDAPALKRADIGVAMGGRGTEAAREAAAMVLSDDNFATIADAVREGRAVYDNLKKAILYLLPTNGGMGLTFLAAIAVGEALPVTPVQLLWINLVTGVTLGLALAFEPPEPDIMTRPPRPPKEPIVSGYSMWRIAFVSVLILIANFGFFALETAQKASLETERTIAVNTLVACQIAYLFSEDTLKKPAPDGKNKLVTVRVDPAIADKLAAEGIKVSGAPPGGVVGTILAWIPAIIFYSLAFFLGVFPFPQIRRQAGRRAHEVPPIAREGLYQN